MRCRYNVSLIECVLYRTCSLQNELSKKSTVAWREEGALARTRRERGVRRRCVRNVSGLAASYVINSVRVLP
jgi:hypothetical protein